MAKKLVGVQVLAIQERYDVMVPVDLKIHVLIELLTSGIVELSEGRFVPSHQELLSLKEPDLLLHPDRTLEDYGVDDGAQLVLI